MATCYRIHIAVEHTMGDQAVVVLLLLLFGYRGGKKGRKLAEP